MKNDMHITTEAETVKQQQTTNNVEIRESTAETQHIKRKKLYNAQEFVKHKQERTKRRKRTRAEDKHAK